MKRCIAFTFLLCISFLLCSCNYAVDNEIEKESSSMGSISGAVSKYQTIMAQQAKKMMEESENYILLDVRTEEEFAEKHIDRAILIPEHEIDFRVENELTDKDALILIYCRSGRRSANAAVKMADMGYTNIYDFGGIIDWPYDIVGG